MKVQGHRGCVKGCLMDMSQPRAWVARRGCAAVQLAPAAKTAANASCNSCLYTPLVTAACARSL